MKKNRKVLLGVILGVIVLSGIITATVTLNGLPFDLDNKTKDTDVDKKDDIELMQKLKNIYGSLDNFKRVISKSANGTDITFYDAAFINDKDFVVIGINYKNEEDDTEKSVKKSFIKKFTTGNNNAIWIKESAGYFNSIAVTDTGDIVVVGDNMDDTAFILKYSGDGEELWKKDLNGGAKTITIDDENNYLVVGSNTIFKLDSDGVQFWKKSFGNKYETFLSSVTQDTDLNYIIVGENSIGELQYSEQTKSKAIIVKYSKNGEELWKKEFNETQNDSFSSVKALSNGGVVVAGMSNSSKYNDDDGSREGSSDGLIIRYDSDGNIVSKIKYDSSAPDESFYDIEIISINGKDDIIIAVGKSYDELKITGSITVNASTKALMVVFDGDNVLFEHTVSGYDASKFDAISFYNKDWRKCILIGSAFDDANRKGGDPYEMFYGGDQGLLMHKL